ncbi:MAG: efflux RND transporter periplasmic adaptor subunit [Caulobacteraceae bacterium]
MSALPQSSRARLALIAAVLVIVGGLIGYGLAHLGRGPRTARPPAAATGQRRKVLYWYDPMTPDQHFDKPGKSPMGMDMVPRYADAGGPASGGAGVWIDPAAEQDLGIRLATVRRGDLAPTVDAVGVIDFNLRDVAIVQARATGFVQRVYARAPGDVVHVGAPIADLLIPAWGGAQDEFLAVKRTGDPVLIAAARQRLRLLGMPEALIAGVERTGRPRNTVTVSTPVGGAIQTLDVRQGMTIGAGATLAQVSGLSTVWLNAAVPEAQTGLVRVGEPVRVDLAAFPGETFAGRVTAILPTAETQSRTLTVRIELPNRGDRLRPGMFATAHLGGQGQPALLVPSEAVIQTGKRNLVMVAETDGRYRPVEVAVGRQAGNETEILAGLGEGQKVVASGQFLLDSEASLTGIQARPLDAGPRR